MQLLTRALKREVATLATAKGRRRSGAFMAEGTKCVLDTLDAFTLRYLFATTDWIEANRQLPDEIRIKTIECGRGELGEMSSMALTPDVIAVYELPQSGMFEPNEIKDELILALDRVQDPGNLGTIMRTSDWMGITTILASTETVDCFNPKTIQATMGAISRVRIIYGNLPEMLTQLNGVPVYGTFLDGTNIYESRLSPTGIIVMGNEGSGISDEVAQLVTQRLLIPSYPEGRPTSESLNVATATAITLSQFIARKYGKNKI